MTPGIACPNPACGHVFAPEAAAGAAVKCPRCGHAMQLRLSAPPPAEVFATHGQIVSLLFPRRKRPRWLIYLVRSVMAACLAGLVIVGIPWLRHTAIPWLKEQAQEEGPKTAAGSVFRSPAFNFSFTLPEAEWRDDGAVRAACQANLALRRTDPSAWMALYYQDFKTHNPRDAEVVDKGIHRLDGYFDNLEWEQKTDGNLGGQPAQHLHFRGDVDHIPMAGDCHILTHQGIVYWFATWAPLESRNEVAEELEDLRGRFALLKERQGWTEKRPQPRVFHGEADWYSLRDTDGLWEKWPDPKADDPAADLLLQARDRVAVLAVDKMAKVEVLLLNSQKDSAAAVQAARAHLLKQQQRDHPETTMEEVADKEAIPDGTGQVGTATGRIIKLNVRNGETRRRYVVLAVVPRPEIVLVIQCECDWRRRSLWERDFSQLVGTLHVKEK